MLSIPRRTARVLPDHLTSRNTLQACLFRPNSYFSGLIFQDASLDSIMLVDQGFSPGNKVITHIICCPWKYYRPHSLFSPDSGRTHYEH